MTFRIKFLATDDQVLWLLDFFGKAGAIGVSNFLLAFFMISLNSMSSGSMK